MLDFFIDKLKKGQWLEPQRCEFRGIKEEKAYIILHIVKNPFRVYLNIKIFNVCVIGIFIERKLCRSEASGSLRALPVPDVYKRQVLEL